MTLAKWPRRERLSSLTMQGWAEKPLTMPRKAGFLNRPRGTGPEIQCPANTPFWPP